MYCDVLLLVIAIYLSFCNCPFLCKKIVSYITVVQHIIILNVLANCKNKLHQICIILSLLDDFSTNSFMAVLIHNLSVHSYSFTFYVRGKKSKLADRKLTQMQDRIGGLQHVPFEGEDAGMADYPVVRFVIIEEQPFIKPGSLKSPKNLLGFPKLF